MVAGPAEKLGTRLGAALVVIIIILNMMKSSWLLKVKGEGYRYFLISVVVVVIIVSGKPLILL